MHHFTDTDREKLFRILEEQNQVLKNQTEDIKQLKQGMYGNTELKQPGLISDMLYVKKWIAANIVRTAYIMGFCAAIGFCAKTAWEWVTKK